MLDFSNEIFTAVAEDVRLAHPGVKMTGEYTRSPSKFPCVTLDETENVTMGHLIDSSHKENFCGVVYRVQVFSNKQSSKRAEARSIFATADAAMCRMGFRRVSYTTTPEIYDSTVYNITATYEAVLSAAGYAYKR